MMGYNAQRSIAIIGGGIGGLSAALAFAKSGAQVYLYEQAKAFQQVGAGIQITPNGAYVLRNLGVEQSFHRCSLPSQAVLPMDGISGRTLCHIPLGSHGQSYRLAHRHCLIDVLVGACIAAGVVLNLGSTLPSPLLAQKQAALPKEIQTADLIIAADGIHSQTRKALCPNDKVIFSKQAAWRTIVPRRDHPDCAKIWMLPHKHVVTYPISSEDLNVVAIEKRTTWSTSEQQRNTSTTWAYEVSPDQLSQQFEGSCSELAQILSSATSVQLWGLFLQNVAGKWSQNNITLLGDAAHPTLPFLAQGANLALEDALILSQICDRYSDISPALTDYETQRKPRVQKTIKAALSHGQKYHLSGIPRTLAHFGLRSIGTYFPNHFSRQLSWLYNYEPSS